MRNTLENLALPPCGPDCPEGDHEHAAMLCCESEHITMMQAGQEWEDMKCEHCGHTIALDDHENHGKD